MGCGASGAEKGNVAEPQMMAPGPQEPHVPAPGSFASPAPVIAAAPVSVGEGHAAESPNSSTRMSGAVTPVLDASWKSQEGGEGGTDAEEDEGEDNIGELGKLGISGRLLEFEPSLQDRVNLLGTFVQTQNLGRTANALRTPLPRDGNDDEASDDMQVLYDLPAENSELDASWRHKIFSYDGIDTPDAELTNVMADTRWAKEVQIKACKIDSSGVQFLDQVVQDRELRALTLARCNLEDGVAAELAVCLGSGRWSSLRLLGLDGNAMVGDTAAHALAEALSVNITLEELSLWGTGIGNAGAKSLAGALKQNKHLKILWLGECEEIGDDSFSALMEALSVNTTLDQLALVMTSVSEELQEEIETVVATRREQRALTESVSLHVAAS